MGITVLSPHDGQPVKVRDQDVGRAVKDREGRIFYVLEKSDGTGYYGAMTRAGGEREEQRALKLEARTHEVEEHKHAVSGGGTGGAMPVHDATGTKRSGGAGRSVFLAILLLIAIVLGWLGYSYLTTGELPGLPLETPQELPEAIDSDPQTEPDGSSDNSALPRPVPGTRMPYPERGLIGAIITTEPQLAGATDNLYRELAFERISYALAA